MTWSKRPANALFWTGIGELVFGSFFGIVGYFQPIVRFGFWLTTGILWLVGIVLLLAGIRARKKYDMAQRLRATGMAGTAQVLGVRPTSVMVNNQPMYDLDLQVNVPNAPPMRVQRREVIPLHLVAKLGLGQPLPVVADPMDPGNIVIEWERF